MHLALFQSPDTVPLALPAVDDRIKPYIPELNQFPGTFPTKLEIIEQSSANVMLLKKLLKELQGTYFVFYEKLRNFNLFKARMSENVFNKNATMHLREIHLKIIFIRFGTKVVYVLTHFSRLLGIADCCQYLNLLILINQDSGHLYRYTNIPR